MTTPVPAAVVMEAALDVTKTKRSRVVHVVQTPQVPIGHGLVTAAAGVQRATTGVHATVATSE